MNGINKKKIRISKRQKEMEKEIEIEAKKTDLQNYKNNNKKEGRAEKREK